MMFPGTHYNPDCGCKACQAFIIKPTLILAGKQNNMFKKKNKIPEKLKALVAASIKQHALNMGVSHYEIEINWMEKDVMDENGGELLGKMTTDLRYLTGFLNLYPAFVERWEKTGNEEADATIAHEMAHVLIAPLSVLAEKRYITEDEFKDAWESITEKTGRMSCKINLIVKEK